MPAPRRRRACWTVVGLFLGTTATAAVRQPVVTPAVQVTKTIQPARAHAEPQLMVHPKDRNVLAIYDAEFLTTTCEFHVSRDGGRTWAKAAGKPVPPEYKACARPTFGPFHAARFGIDGTIYVVAAGSDSPPGESAPPTPTWRAAATSATPGSFLPSPGRRRWSSPREGERRPRTRSATSTSGWRCIPPIPNASTPASATAPRSSRPLGSLPTTSSRAAASSRSPPTRAGPGASP